MQTQDLKQLIKHKCDIYRPDNSICKCYSQHISKIQIFPFYIKLQIITCENSEKGDLWLNIDAH